MSIRGYRGVTPKIAATAYIDPSAQVIGDVVIGERSSVWPNTTVRGDVNYIRIGDETNVQDNCCLHVQRDEWPLIVGDVGKIITAVDTALPGEFTRVECGTFSRRGFTPACENSLQRTIKL